MPEELQRQSIANSFEHELVHRKSHYFIKSACKRCGASEGAVSIYDGSLQKWEDEHECPGDQLISACRKLIEQSRRLVAKH
jgi:hypothetical protein